MKCTWLLFMSHPIFISNVFIIATKTFEVLRNSQLKINALSVCKQFGFQLMKVGKQSEKGKTIFYCCFAGVFHEFSSNMREFRKVFLQQTTLLWIITSVNLTALWSEVPFIAPLKPPNKQFECFWKYLAHHIIVQAFQESHRWKCHTLNESQ